MASAFTGRSCLTIRTLGAFSVQQGGRAVPGLASPNSAASRLLMCLLSRRQEPFSVDELVALLWPKGRVKDPAKALVALVYRLRQALSAGKGRGTDYILSKQHRYVWNSQAPCFLDVASFESLCQQAQEAAGEDEQISLYQQAFSLYQGDFLPQKFQPSCVVAAASHNKRLYLRVIGRLAQLYAARDDYAAIVQMCESALTLEGTAEFIYELYIDALLRLGQPAAALERYQTITQYLSDVLGLCPSPQLHALYWRIYQALGHAPAPLAAVRASLAEAEPSTGALLCSLEAFRGLYQFASRLTLRSGQVAFLASLNIHDAGGQGQASALQLLTHVALQQLPGDCVVSTYNQTQLLLLLFSLPYEDCSRLLASIEQAFCGRYDGAPVSLSHELAVLDACPPTHKEDAC